jgi:hypothetical protein
MSLGRSILPRMISCGPKLSDCCSKVSHNCFDRQAALAFVANIFVGVAYLRQRTLLIVFGDTLNDRPKSRTDIPSALRFWTSSC